MVERRRAPSSGPSLEDADIIVAGGMGLGGPEHFALAEELAGALGGVVGTTTPPRAPASSSASAKCSGPPSPIPPATMMSASSSEGPLEGA